MKGEKFQKKIEKKIETRCLQFAKALVIAYLLYNGPTS